ncbi:hypothetical protein HDU76_011443, partial [Blyttiomyces sp. JEL0837]
MKPRKVTPHILLSFLEAVTVKATPAVKAIGLSKLLERFPALETLWLVPSTKTLVEHSPQLVHELAAAFTGHTTLRRIHCGSDHIIRGALSGCPRLEEIHLSFLHSWLDDNGGLNSGAVLELE